MATVEALLNLCPTHPSSEDIHFSDNINVATELATNQVTMNSGDNNTAMSPDYILASGQNALSYMTDKHNQPGISF